MTTQVSVGVVNPDARAVADAFTAGQQAGHDQRDAEILNRQFAGDAIRGSPSGALVEGYWRIPENRMHTRATGTPSDA